MLSLLPKMAKFAISIVVMLSTVGCSATEFKVKGIEYRSVRVLGMFDLKASSVRTTEAEVKIGQTTNDNTAALEAVKELGRIASKL